MSFGVGQQRVQHRQLAGVRRVIQRGEQAHEFVMDVVHRRQAEHVFGFERERGHEVFAIGRMARTVTAHGSAHLDPD